MTRCICALGLICSFPLFSQYSLVLKTGDAYEIQEASQLNVNGKEAGRIWTEAASTEVNPKLSGKLRQEKFSEATCLRKSDEGVLVSRAGNDWQIWIPEPKGKDPEAASSLWTHAQIGYKKSKNDKELTPVPWERLYMVVPGADAAESLETLSRNFPQFTWKGRPPADSFWERMRLRSAIVKTYPTSAAAKRIHDAFQQSLVAYVSGWDRGGVTVAYLQTGLDTATASDWAFPSDAEMEKLRNRLRTAKSWLDRQSAILEALNAGSLCDSLLAKYLAFERFETSFPRLIADRHTCFGESAGEHLARARQFVAKKEYEAARAEFRKARLRDPDNADVEREQDSLRLVEARRATEAALAKRGAVDAMSPAQVQLNRYLQLARNYLSDGNIAQATDNLKRAQAVDPSSPEPLMMQAQLAQRQGELIQAIALLDKYEAAGITEAQFTQADNLRTQLVYNLDKLKKSIRAQVAAAVSQQHFLGALQSSAKGLELDPDDPLFLYSGGVNAAIMRRPDDAKKLLDRYLKISDSLAGVPKQRQTAMRVLSMLAPPAVAPAADPKAVKSWFSGNPLAPGVFYDPVSLAFQPRIASIQASRKLNVAFQWQRDNLVSVVSKFEDNHTGANMFNGIMGAVAASGGNTVEIVQQGADSDIRQFHFTYYDKFPQVLQVSAEHSESHEGSSTQSLTGGSTSGPYRAPQVDTVSKDDNREWQDSSDGFLTLWNNPRVNPDIARVATGQIITTGFSGNAYFNPFSWDGIHIFDFFYDNLGRVVRAQEHGQTTGALQFTWDGNRLLKIVKLGNGQENPTPVYTRTLNYSGDKLESEVIEFNGKSSKIVYTYDKANKLIRAECGDDFSLDGRSRKVGFN